MTRSILFDLGNTLVRYYEMAEFPAILARSLDCAAAGLVASEEIARLGLAVFVDAVVAVRMSVGANLHPLSSRTPWTNWA